MMRIWMNGKCRTCLRLLLCLLLCVSLLPVTAFAEAEDTLDLTKKVNLTLQYEIEGAQFRLYKVAEVSQDLEFTLTGDFAGYPVEVNGLDSAGWRALAETLAVDTQAVGSTVRTVMLTGIGACTAVPLTGDQLRALL